MDIFLNISKIMLSKMFSHNLIKKFLNNNTPHRILLIKQDHQIPIKIKEQDLKMVVVKFTNQTALDKIQERNTMEE